jgi:hypothetical protein
MSPRREKFQMWHFAKANPVGPDRENVPVLLRRVADSIEELGDVDISDICFHNDFDIGGEPNVHMVVYYTPREDEDEDEDEDS